MYQIVWQEWPTKYFMSVLCWQIFMVLCAVKLMYDIYSLYDTHKLIIGVHSGLVTSIVVDIRRRVLMIYNFREYKIKEKIFEFG